MRLLTKSAEISHFPKKCSFSPFCTFGRKLGIPRRPTRFLFWHLVTCITPNQCFSMEIPRILKIMKIMKMGDFREKCENEQKVRLFAKKRTFPARGGNPSIAQGILMVLGAQMAQSALWGKKCGFL